MAATDMQTACWVCGEKTSLLQMLSVLRRYEVGYHRCQTCHHIQTDEPVWLPEAYRTAIADVDLGQGMRARLSSSRSLLTYLALGVRADGEFSSMDFGAGDGLYVRTMRDLGFDVRGSDAFSEMGFAQPFIVDDPFPSGSRYTSVTAFEVLEHLRQPNEWVAEAGACTDLILLSTDLQPQGMERLESWQYCAPETGQHISLYSYDSLSALLRRHRFELMLSVQGFHVAVKQKPTRVRALLAIPLLKLVLHHRLTAACAAGAWTSSGGRSLLLNDVDTVRASVPAEPAIGS